MSLGTSLSFNTCRTTAAAVSIYARVLSFRFATILVTIISDLLLICPGLFFFFFFKYSAPPRDPPPPPPRPSPDPDPRPRAAPRPARNTPRARLFPFLFFEPLERFKVMVRSPRARPVVFVPIRLPNVATADVIQRFGYLFRRTLLDRGLLPDLERLLSGEEPGTAPSGAPRSRLLEHIEANLLYYSTAIISAGDPAARYVALSKLRDPAGRPLTDVVENTVIGRVGNAIALPLRSAGELPAQWRGGAPAPPARPPPGGGGRRGATSPPRRRGGGPAPPPAQPGRGPPPTG